MNSTRNSTITRLATVVVVLLLFTSIAAEAQPPRGIPRVGVLRTAASPFDDDLRHALRELGYVEGQNIAFEWRSSQVFERFHDLAVDLVRSKVSVIVASINPAIQAAQAATRTTPVVMVLAIDPIALGFVTSLAQPGGNITGLTVEAPGMIGKRLQLLKEGVSNLSRVAALGNPTEPSFSNWAREAAAAAAALGLKLQLVEAQSSDELEHAFAAMARERADALLVLPAGFFAHRARIARLAAKRRLPTICLTKGYVEAGCLMSYAASFSDQYRRAAAYVDKILKGAKPADLPVEQPTKFEFVINVKTAKALSLTIPPSLLLRADHVLE